MAHFLRDMLSLDLKISRETFVGSQSQKSNFTKFYNGTGAAMMEQIGIALFGVTAIFLSQHRSGIARKWASVFGLAGQPFWFYSSITAEQWGIVALCFLYSFSWGRGFYNQWIRPA